MNNIITIVTPSLNQGRFIEQTINSVLSQEGDFFIDYIIADGGSTDNSVEIIKKYDRLLKNKKYPIKCKGISYRWWSKPDKGQSNAINQGFKIAKGDILAWMNSDDFYEPGAFDSVVKKFKENPDIDLIYGDVYRINNTKPNNPKMLQRSRQGNFSDFNYGMGFKICQPSTFFTKRIIDKIGYLDEQLHYAMDYEFWIRILKYGKALYLPRTLSGCRLWEMSKSYTQTKQWLKEKRTIRKKYGLPIVDHRTICNINRRLGFRRIRSKYPKFYKFCKNIIYNINDKFKYKKQLK